MFSFLIHLIPIPLSYRLLSPNQINRSLYRFEIQLTERVYFAAIDNQPYHRNLACLCTREMCQDPQVEVFGNPYGRTSFHDFNFSLTIYCFPW